MSSNVTEAPPFSNWCGRVAYRHKRPAEPKRHDRTGTMA